MGCSGLGRILEGVNIHAMRVCIFIVETQALRLYNKNGLDHLQRRHHLCLPENATNIFDT
jgi:hypothetical protein